MAMPALFKGRLSLPVIGAPLFIPGVRISSSRNARPASSARFRR